MLTFAARVTVMCFAASYASAFALDLWHLFRPRPILRVLAIVFGAAGLLAHIIFLAYRAVTPAEEGGVALPLSSPMGSLLLLSLILAVFYVGEAIHHGRVAWAVFVLPIVLGLIGLAVLREPSAAAGTGLEYYWGLAHGTLLILAAVGVSIAFIASTMYLLQLRRLQTKAPPGEGVPLFSLERLELMHRRAILWSFPLLTAGLLAGFALQAYQGLLGQGWDNPRILSVVGLWLVVAILLFLRFRMHVRGRQVAIVTMVAFAILVVALVFSHPFVTGGGEP
jgi:ABC-type uncharacterized transport system permease subunit